MINQRQYIIDKSKEKLSLAKMKQLYEDVKKSGLYGDITWHSEQIKLETLGVREAEEMESLMNKIEETLMKNNDEYTRYPCDFVHGQMSYDAYRYLIQEDEVVKFSDNFKWTVLRVFNEPSEDTNVAKKGSFFTGILYFNEKKNQMVLAYRGIDIDILSIFKDDGQLKSQLNGIILHEVIPQLEICFKVTEKANELAVKNNCYLSFTGYSNGAWLAEYSIYFSNFYFKNAKTRAVLFESPGIYKSDIIETSKNFIDQVTEFNLRNLDVVNYLTTPCFSNTINKHFGKIYRIFFEQEDEYPVPAPTVPETKSQGSKQAKQHSKHKNKNKSGRIVVEFLERCKEIPNIGNYMNEKLSEPSLKFWLDGIIAATSFKRLRKIVEAFDEKTSKPKYYELISFWPLLKFKFEKNLINHFFGLANKTPESLVELIQMQDLFKKPNANIISKTILPLIINELNDGFAPNIQILLNITFELIRENVNLDFFSNQKFYKKHLDLYLSKEDCETINDRNEHSIQLTGYNLYFRANYDSKAIAKAYEEELNINEGIGKIDLLLFHLGKKKVSEREERVLKSNIILKQLKQLKSSFDIKILKSTDKNMEQIKIKSKNQCFTIEMIKEKLMRLMDVSPKLKEILQTVKQRVTRNSEINLDLNLLTRVKFIGRESFLKLIDDCLYLNHQTEQIVVLQGQSGCGKSCLANEFAYSMHDYNGTICRWFSARTQNKFEAEYRRFAKIFKIPDENNLTMDHLVTRVNGRIRSNDLKFIFILDNVERLSDIVKVVNDELPREQIKCIITTTHMEELNKLKSYKKLHVDFFTSYEAILFVDEYLTRKLNEEQRDHLLEMIKSSSNDEKYLPIKLVHFTCSINQNFSNANRVFEVTRLSSSTNVNIVDLYLENKLNGNHFLFDDLLSKSENAFKILSYCQYLDGDMISNNILVNLNEDFQKELTIIANLGLIKIIDEKDMGGIRVHRLVQDELKAHRSESLKEKYANDEYNILNHLVDILVLKVNEVDKHYSRSIPDQKQVVNEMFIHDYAQIKYLLNQITISKLNINKPHSIFRIDETKIIKLYSKLGYFNIYHELNYFEALGNFKALYKIEQNFYNKHDHTDISQCLYFQAFCYAELGHHYKALDLKRKCYDMRCRLFKKDDHVDIAHILNSMGESYEKLGDNKKALDCFEKAYEMRVRLYRDQDHVETSESLTHLAIIHERLDDDQTAAKYSLKAYEMRCRIYKNSDHLDVASSLINLAIGYDRLNESIKALKFYDQAFEMRCRLYKGMDHPEVADALNCLAVCYTRVGDEQRALELKMQAYAMRCRIYEDIDHPDLAQSCYSQAISYEKIKDDKNALDFYLRAYEMRSRIYKHNSDHHEIAQSLNSVGVSLSRQNDFGKALEHFLKAYEIRSRLYNDKDHPEMNESLKNLKKVYGILGHHDKVEEVNKKLENISRK